LPEQVQEARRIVGRAAGENGLNRLAANVLGRRSIHNHFERSQLCFLRSLRGLAEVKLAYACRRKIGCDVALLDQRQCPVTLALRRFCRLAAGTCTAVFSGLTAHVILHKDANAAPL